MYYVYLFDDWDRLTKEWKVKTKKEAEELKEYIENKMNDLNLELQFSSCVVVDEVEEGNKEVVDRFFEDILEDKKNLKN